MSCGKPSSVWEQEPRPVRAPAGDEFFLRNMIRRTAGIITAAVAICLCVGDVSPAQSQVNSVRRSSQGYERNPHSVRTYQRTQSSKVKTRPMRSGRVVDGLVIGGNTINNETLQRIKDDVRQGGMPLEARKKLKQIEQNQNTMPRATEVDKRIRRKGNRLRTKMNKVTEKMEDSLEAERGVPFSPRLRELKKTLSRGNASKKLKTNTLKKMKQKIRLKQP